MNLRQKMIKGTSVYVVFTILKKLQWQNAGMAHLFCFPFAARPSSFSISRVSNFSAPASAPVKLLAMRAGVTDLGRTTIPFATVDAELQISIAARRLVNK